MNIYKYIGYTAINSPITIRYLNSTLILNYLTESTLNNFFEYRQSRLVKNGKAIFTFDIMPNERYNMYAFGISLAKDILVLKDAIQKSQAIKVDYNTILCLKTRSYAGILAYIPSQKLLSTIPFNELGISWTIV